MAKEIGNKNLLLELTTEREGDIKKAIKNCLRVRMSYDDKKGGKGKRERYILPVVYGRTKNGKLAIRAFQTAGSTKRGVPKYKLFLLNNIYSWSNGKRNFRDYEQELLKNGLNEYGDMSFSAIYAITPFAKGFGQMSSEDVPIDSEPLTKNEIPPSIEKGKGDKKAEKPQKRVRSKPKQEKSIDITQTDKYNTNGTIINAPKTEPITKGDIEQTKNIEDYSDTTYSTKNVEQEPQETDGEFKIDKDNILTKSYQDMMKRMDNLNKDDEDENNEDDNNLK